MMKILRPTALTALALTLAFASPLVAQETDAATEGDAAASAMHSMDHDAMGEGGCSCPCMDMKSMHEGMKSGSASMDHESHAEMDHEGHAEMDSAEHAAMMQKHQEMMEGCSCGMMGEKGENMQAGMQGMKCSMHGQHGDGDMDGMDMKSMHEGMQHQHGMESADDADASDGS